ncbi:MAG TPA: hypothetical protein VI756_30095 [Blastocatellia bacterium]
MKPNRQISTASGLRQRGISVQRPMFVVSFGPNPCPSDPSYAWLKLEGITKVGITAAQPMAVTDLSLSQH